MYIGPPRGERLATWGLACTVVYTLHIYTVYLLHTYHKYLKSMLQQRSCWYLQYSRHLPSPFSEGDQFGRLPTYSVPYWRTRYRVGVRAATTYEYLYVRPWYDVRVNTYYVAGRTAISRVATGIFADTGLGSSRGYLPVVVSGRIFLLLVSPTD